MPLSLLIKLHVSQYIFMKTTTLEELKKKANHCAF